MKLLITLPASLVLAGTAPAQPLTADVDPVRMAWLRLLAPGVEPSEHARLMFVAGCLAGGRPSHVRWVAPDKTEAMATLFRRRWISRPETPTSHS